MPKYRVQAEVTLKFMTFVEVEANDPEDPELDRKVNIILENKDVREMAFEEQENEIWDVQEIEGNE